MKRFFCLFLSVLISTLSLLACTASTDDYRTDADVTTLMNTITSSLPDTDGFSLVGEGFLTPSLWGEDCSLLLDALESSAVCISARADMNIDEIGLFAVKEGMDARRVAAIAADYLHAQSLRYRDLLAAYNPAELPKTDGGRVLVCGRYVLYTLLDEPATEQAQKALVEALTH